MLRIHRDSYGTGAGSVRAHLTDDYVFVVFDDLELLPNEEFMLENGKQDAVVQVRSQFLLAIQASFRAAVERATGRKVVGFTSTTSVREPRFSVEIFKLG